MHKSKFQQSLQKSLAKQSPVPTQEPTPPVAPKTIDKASKTSDKTPLTAENSSSSAEVKTGDGPIQLEGDVDVNDLVPFLGACCVIASCYPVYPDCLGTVSESTLLCLSSRILFCKPSKGYSDDYCKLCLLDFDCVPVKVCCRVSHTR